ncbi:MAG: alpha-amylase family glycosyl hydrolase [Armatimonadota bacterium]
MTEDRRDTAWREFHVSRNARDRYEFDQALFATNGDVIFANFHAARVFAQKMNGKRDLINYPEQAIKAGQINAMGLIDEILHYVVALYRRQQNPNVMAEALDFLDDSLGAEKVDAALRAFADDFPPVAVYERALTAEEYLTGSTGGTPNREIMLEELLLLWLENMDPAFAPFMELFDDERLAKETPYLAVISDLREFFIEQPAFGPENQSLPEMLRAPAVVAPHSLPGQFEYILAHWGYLLGKYLYRLLSSLDFIKEEEKAIFFGPGPSLVPVYGPEENERFSQDKEWMPNVVLMAKNAYVWLSQLSRQYGRNIDRLDQVPDEELDMLARRGFTGLWLIGLWERSVASQQIKQWCGNPEAVASAYSLKSYEIAGDLGGPEALDNLRERAWRRGVRLASDMVPNHMGIDSSWVIEHPDWFIGLDYCPFPAYSFTGASLSGDDRVNIQVEDHYFSRSDAAVVFKRRDKLTGSEKFIYHGNDGTSMPWNDTAQLDYLNPAVREAVIQTILHVARQFPIIRFDAAMTLTQKHFQRLWFPEPGAGGAIPSRAEHGMSRKQFLDAMPQEFWREVVDRVAAEVPDTLLLAEAFWLMEGYFVRTLGMHRVYNSAFMNMLRDEENAKYRWVLKNTMEFDPEILKRFVNFMNNPDEHTAVDQFGKGDKYFGICTVMCTLPGLPMFGHGQVEGFAEKYGMEYRRAYWDEHPDGWLIDRHERQIFPLLHKRYLFAEARNFQLYDFWTAEGHVDEDVLAYSNRSGDERALVLYHNKYATARGWIRTSAGAAVKDADGGKQIVQRTLGEGLALRNDGHYFTIFRDCISGLEFIRNSAELCERGLYVELGAYQHHAFIDFREVLDNEWRHYEHLTGYLNGRGVPSIHEALREILLQPVQQPFTALVNAEAFTRLLAAKNKKLDPALLDEMAGKAEALLGAIRDFAGGQGDATAIAREMHDRLARALRPRELAGGEIGAYLQEGLGSRRESWGTLFGWLFVHDLGKAVADAGFEETSRSWLDEWQLGRMLAGVLRDFALDENAAEYAVALVKVLTGHQRWFAGGSPRHEELLHALFADSDVLRVVQVNRHQETLFFNKEAFEKLLWWLFLIAAIQLPSESDAPQRALAECYQAIRALHGASERSDYQVERLLEAFVTA